MPREECTDVLPLSPEHRLVPADGYSVCQWSPDPTGKDGPTQVHVTVPLVLEVGGDPLLHMVIRMKSRRAIQEMIDVLAEHRDAVWPEK